MNLSPRLRVILFFSLPGLLLFGCSPAAGVQDIEITFDGERCQYEGPEVIVEGQVVVVLNNPTDHEFLHIHLGEFVQGKTWQDLVEYQGGSTLNLGSPLWMYLALPESVDGDDSGAARGGDRYFREWEFSLDPGNYGIVCAADDGNPTGVWLAGPIEVSQVASE